MPKIVLTFDYELFLGKDSGTLENCLLKPVKKILDLFSHYRACGIFFIDATYLLTLKKYQHPSLSLCGEQIKEIAAAGCDIGLHLHPQWLDACPAGDRWKFSSLEKYDIHSLDESQILGLFEQGLDILYHYISPVRPNYRIKSFRAGGWLINPFEKISTAFRKFGIEIDSSVLPGVKKNIGKWQYDFRSAPKDLLLWRFSRNPLLPQENGEFLELPVTTGKITGRELLLLGLKKVFSEKNNIYGDGQLLVGRKNIWQALERIFKGEMRPLTVDGISRRLFFVSLKSVGEKNLLVWEIHPKMLTAVGLELIKYLVENYQTAGLDNLPEFFERENG